MRTLHLALTYTIYGLLFATLITSCRPEDTADSVDARAFDAKIATQWMDMARTLTKKCAGFTPPVAGRAFGYMGLALYETVVPGMPEYSSLSNQLTNFAQNVKPENGQEYHWPLAANAAMASMARKLYGNMTTEYAAQVDALETQLRTEYPGIGADVIARSEAYGQQVAEAIFAYSTADGGHEGYLTNFPTYEIPTGEGFWVPTSTTNLKAMQPYWGNNRSFVPNCTPNTQPAAPIIFSTADTSVFYAQALQVYAVTSNLTDEQKIIAKYWSDDPGEPGTPPGHSISITTQVIEAENATLAVAAEAYCKVGIAISDAFVSCWKCKYTYNLMRPVTYIRQQINPSWGPILGTPPFPEYTSGHSVQSAATAQALSDMFGYNYVFTDKTHALRSDINGAPRSYDSFFEFAEEAAISRLYGGIHYIEAIEKGINQGKKVGTELDKLQFRNF